MLTDFGAKIQILWIETDRFFYLLIDIDLRVKNQSFTRIVSKDELHEMFVVGVFEHLLVSMVMELSLSTT